MRRGRGGKAFAATVVAVAAPWACGEDPPAAPPVEDAGATGEPDATILFESGAPADGGATSDATFLGLDELPPPIDAALDVPFPDHFTVPDAVPPEASLPEAGPEAGCGAAAVTCNGTVATTCGDGGASTAVDCASTGRVCAPGFGCVTCVPGSGSCSGAVATQCKADGSGTTTTTCDPLQGLTCNAGSCVGVCAPGTLGQSYIGCEYYAVTLANERVLNQTDFYFSVAVANTGSAIATVTFDGGGLAAPSSVMVAPSQVLEVSLPWVTALSRPVGGVTTARVNGGAYRIRSTQPVSVYQYSPRDYVFAFDGGTKLAASADASLLLPTNALTGTYRVSAWPTWHTPGVSGGVASCTTSTGDAQLPGLLAVVATEDATQVTLNPTASIQAGAGLSANGGTITLQRGDVLQVASALDQPTRCAYGADLSGSLVSATKPVMVFGGHDCTFVPAATGLCDHMEEVIFPLESLGTEYFVTLPANRAGTPRQYVKVVGTAAATQVTFDPAVRATATLGAGQILTFEVTQDFRASATNPVLVAQYMESQMAFTADASVTNAGDPSQSLAVATAQFRKSYDFVAPPNYEENWVNVIAPAGATVRVDGTTVTGFSAIGSTGWSVARFALCSDNAVGCTGVHHAISGTPFGIQVYGYGKFVSYMVPGGLDLRRQ